MEKKFVVMLLCVGVSLALGGGPTRGRAGHSGLSLKEPALVPLATEVEGQEEGSNFLQQEAGMAAYVQVDQPIDIPRLRGTFKVVEQLSDTYLTGQIDIPNLEENWHPRVFVTHSADGQGSWIVAYHPYREPTSMMLAMWIQHAETALTGTTLELAIREVLRSAGLSPLPATIEGIRYYHFQNPAADRIMLIREDTQGEDFFYLTIPSGLGILDASWVAYDNVGGWSEMHIDGERVVSLNGDLQFGDLLSRLRVDSQHKISVWRGNYGIVLLYQDH